MLPRTRERFRLVRIRIGNEELALDWDDWETRVRDGRVPPEALVQFGPVTGDDFVRAGDLEMWRSLRSDAAILWQRELVRGGPPIVTALLIGVQIRIWWWQWLPWFDEFVSRELPNSTPALLENAQVHRLITMGFLHFTYDHIALNLLFLGYAGWALERALGRANLVTIYLASVLGGSLLSAMFAPWTASIGASGGVFGLVAATVVFGFVTRPDLLPERSRRVFGFALLPYLLLSFWNGLFSETTDNWAHGGGLLVGAALGFVLDPEPLQRRAGWNRRWRLAVAGVSGAVLAVLAILGPRIEPVADADLATTMAQRTKRSPFVAWEEPAYRPLVFDVPAGWRPGTTSAGDLGFTSPVDDRAWAVRERKEAAPVDLVDVSRRWLDGLGRAFPEVAASEAAPAVVAGRPGLAIEAHVGDRVLEWRGTTRGLYVLEEVWEVERGYAHRLAPLRDRLRERVVWHDPIALVEARDSAARAPDARKVQRAFAAALAEVGEVEASRTLWRGLIEGAPGDEDAWAGLLALARWYPEAVEDDEALWAEALAANPTPRMAVEVATSLDAAGREAAARGLLDIAWAQHPGDRKLRRARRASGLSVDLEPDRHLPVSLVIDAATGQLRSDAEVSRWQRAPLDLPTAESLGSEVLDARNALAARAIDALETGDATDELLLLAHGRVPDDRPAALAGLGEDLRTVAVGGRVAWMPPQLRDAVAHRIATDPEWPTRVVPLAGAPAGP